MVGSETLRQRQQNLVYDSLLNVEIILKVNEFRGSTARGNFDELT
jgi:hypothetical protein